MSPSRRRRRRACAALVLTQRQSRAAAQHGGGPPPPAWRRCYPIRGGSRAPTAKVHMRYYAQYRTVHARRRRARRPSPVRANRFAATSRHHLCVERRDRTPPLRELPAARSVWQSDMYGIRREAGGFATSGRPPAAAPLALRLRRGVTSLSRSDDVLFCLANHGHHQL